MEHFVISLKKQKDRFTSSLWTTDYDDNKKAMYLDGLNYFITLISDEMLPTVK